MRCDPTLSQNANGRRGKHRRMFIWSIQSQKANNHARVYSMRQLVSLLHKHDNEIHDHVDEGLVEIKAVSVKCSWSLLIRRMGYFSGLKL